MMKLPVMTKPLARRLQQVITSLHIAGMTSVQQQPGNPYDIQMQRFGNATAYMARAVPVLGWWNRVLGLESEDIPWIDDILIFFRQYNLRCYIDIGPGSFTEELASQLVEHGLAPCHIGTVLYGLPQTAVPESPVGMQVHEIQPDDAELFVDLWADGFEIPQGTERNMIKGIRRGWFSIPDNHLYVAHVDGVPAAIAALYIKDSIGHLNVGGTLPAFRKRGCHTILTYRRIADAARMRCELVMGETGSFGSVSQNNMERAGLRIAYTTITWVDRQI